jgi:hypothetical protein
MPSSTPSCPAGPSEQDVLGDIRVQREYISWRRMSADAGRRADASAGAEDVKRVAEERPGDGARERRARLGAGVV